MKSTKLDQILGYYKLCIIVLTWDMFLIFSMQHFVGNEDKTTVVTHELPVPIKARYVRVVAQKWQGRPCMRIELYGCSLP